MRITPLVLGAALATQACSPYSISGPRPPSLPLFGPARADVATICVVRSAVMASAVTFIVHDNGKLVGATRGQSYFCYEAAPGMHAIVSQTFDSTDTPGSLQLEVAAGRRYYVAQEHEGVASLTSVLAQIDPDIAGERCASCVHRALTDAPGHEQVPPAVPFAPAADLRASAAR